MWVVQDTKGLASSLQQAVQASGSTFLLQDKKASNAYTFLDIERF